jgi:hypothetical protein
MANKNSKQAIMTYDDTKFVKMFKKYGLKRIIKSLDFQLAIVLTLVFLISVYYSHTANQLIDIFGTYATIASGMVAIVIASLAIIVSISDEKFIAFISQEPKVYRNLLFLFWYASILAGISIAINITGFIFTKIASNYTNINLMLLTIGTFLTVYAVFVVIMAVGSVMRFGLYRAEYTRIKNSN